MFVECDASINDPTSKKTFARAVVGIGYEPYRKAAYLVVVFDKTSFKFSINQSIKLFSSTIQMSNRYVMLRDVDALELEKLKSILLKISQKRFPIETMPLLDKILSLKPRSKKATLNQSTISKKKKVIHSNLKQLILTELSTIPKEIYNLKRLTQLHLVNCNLKSIPRELIALASTLKSLVLNSNQIREIPRWFFPKFKHLIVFEISDNLLYKIPYDVAISSTLRTLNFSHNQLHSLPGMLCYKMFSKAQYERIDLSNNQLYYLYCFEPTQSDRFRNSKTHIIDITNNLFHLSEEEVQSRFREIEPTKTKTKYQFSLFFLSFLKLLSTKNLSSIYNEREVPLAIYDYFQENVFVCNDCIRLKIGTARRTFNLNAHGFMDLSWVPEVNRSHFGFFSLHITCNECFDKHLKNR